MLTGRRIRERQAAEAAGLPLPAPPVIQRDISPHEHANALNELRRAHAAEVATLQTEIARLTAEVEALKGSVTEGETSAAEVATLPSDEPAAPPAPAKTKKNR